MTTTTRKQTYRVRIRETRLDEREWEARVCAHDQGEAETTALRRLFGRGVGFQTDAGLGRGYGQVVRRYDESTWTCVTGRVSIETEAA